MLVRWSDHDSSNPAFDSLRRQMDRFFDEFDRPDIFRAAPVGSLPVSFQDTGSALVFSADVPDEMSNFTVPTVVARLTGPNRKP